MSRRVRRAARSVSAIDDQGGPYDWIGERHLRRRGGAGTRGDGGPAGRGRRLQRRLHDPRRRVGGDPHLAPGADVPADVRVVLGNPWHIEAAKWLPSGRGIAVAASSDTTLTIPNPSLWRVDLNSEVEHRMPGCDARLGGVIHHDMPAWDLMTSNIITVVDDHTALVTNLRRGRYEVLRVALEGPISVDRLSDEDRSSIVLDVHPDSQSLLVAVTSLHAPPDLVCRALSGGCSSRVTRLNDETLRTWPQISVRPFTVRSHDGMELDAWFLSRSDASGSLPTVLFIHGGPFASTGQAFRYDFILLASHGFGVCFANFRGSAGYGNDFTRAIMGNWGAKGFPDHMATIDEAIARGLADPARLGVWGPSHGGFATAWIIGHSNRFKAAVVEAATTNLVSAYYTSDAAETTARDLGGRPCEIPAIYSANSPITYAHRCTTPTLIVHGEEDLRCPISEAEQLFRALCDAGCVCEFLRIPQCNHLGDSAGPLPAREAQNEALLGWFQRFLR